MATTISYNKATKAITVTIALTATAQIEKVGLAKGVIENQILTDAAAECSRAAGAALNGVSSKAIDDDATAQKAAIDAAAVLKKAAAPTSNVTGN